MMLIQLLLPLADNNGVRFSQTDFAEVHAELTARFGGLTAYNRAPARGFWNSGGAPQRDDIVVLEVMVDTLDRVWWRDLRSRLETTFRQESIVIRAQAIQLL